MAVITGNMPDNGGVYTAIIGDATPGDDVPHAGIVTGSLSILSLLESWNGQELPRPALVGLAPVVLNINDPVSVMHGLHALTQVVESQDAPELYDASDEPADMIH